MTLLEDPNSRGSETKANDVEGNNSQEDQNQRRAVVTGFHEDTTGQEVQDTLKEIITTMEMLMDQNQIKCPAKPITHAFMQLKDNDERDEIYQVSEHIEERVERTKNKDITGHGCRNAEERFHQKRRVYLKCYIHTKHNVPLV